MNSQVIRNIFWRQPNSQRKLLINNKAPHDTSFMSYLLGQGLARDRNSRTIRNELRVAKDIDDWWLTSFTLCLITIILRRSSTSCEYESLQKLWFGQSSMLMLHNCLLQNWLQCHKFSLCYQIPVYWMEILNSSVAIKSTNCQNRTEIIFIRLRSDRSFFFKSIYHKI